jgi:hypothetical protein
MTNLNEKLERFRLSYIVFKRYQSTSITDILINLKNHTKYLAGYLMSIQDQSGFQISHPPLPEDLNL